MCYTYILYILFINKKNLVLGLEKFLDSVETFLDQLFSIFVRGTDYLIATVISNHLFYAFGNLIINPFIQLA